MPERLARDEPKPSVEVRVEEDRSEFLFRISAVVLSSGQTVVEAGAVQVVRGVELGAGVEEGRRLSVLNWTILSGLVAVWRWI